MAAPELPREDGFLAKVLAALRPEFRPRWWEFAITFGLLALTYPFVTRLFWVGRGMTIAVVSGYTVRIGLPTEIIALSILWKLDDRRARAGARALLQVTIATVMLVPLNISGGMAYRASVERSRMNGLAIVREILSFREKHGRLPESLDEIERSGRLELPKPTFGGDYDYELLDDGYILRLELPSGGTFVHDGRGSTAPRDDADPDKP